MKLTDPCGCFPTGKHYPGIAHLLRVRAAGLAEGFDPDARWIDLPIASIDTETTGTEPATDRIIEVGVVIGIEGEPTGRHSWLVNPAMPIPEQSVQVHGITNEDVADKPSFAEVVCEVAEVLQNALPAAYNAEFDRGFLLAELQRAGVNIDRLPPALQPEVQWIDPLVFARELQAGKRSRALGVVCERLGITIEQAHRATDDAEAALRVLYAFAADKRVPKAYGALIQEQRRLGRAQDEARRFWRK